MNINRHNYETFFLLYVDNELSGAERNVVEEFIRVNPDLTKELVALQKSKLQPAEFVFKGKAGLLKNEKDFAVTLDKLLLYIDDELDATEVLELKMLLASDDGMANELKLLQQTKSLPDSNIIFAGKSSLYRKETTDVVPFGWWKLAVAAVFIGCSIWAGAIFYNGRSKVEHDPVAINKSNKPVLEETKNNTLIVPEQILAPEKITVPQEQNIVLLQKVPGKNGIRKITAAPAVIKEKVPGLHGSNNLAAAQQIIIKPNNNLPKPYFNNDKNTVKENALAAILPQTQYSNNTETKRDGSGEQTGLKNNVYTASLNETADENKEDKFTFSDDEPKKSKLTGFLRKAKRVLERNTKIGNSDDNVKVANLEFAIH